MRERHACVSACQRTRLLQVEDEPDVKPHKRGDDVMLGDVVLPRPRHGQDRAVRAHPAAVQAGHRVAATLARRVLVRAAAAALAQALHMLLQLQWR